MKTGDQVIIVCKGVRYDGHLVLASDNEKAMMLGFEAIIDGHVGMMPVLLHDDGVYRSIVADTVVEIRPTTGLSSHA